MPPVSVLIKPASGSCNLRCSYCFYTDEVSRRAAHGCGVMSDETMECLIRRIFESAETQVSIGFQGGEPLLAGLAYYERFTRLAEAYNRRGVPVQYSIQTNGLLLDEDWAAFFRRHDFLVGISVDGLRETHDANRVDPAGGGRPAGAPRRTLQHPHGGQCTDSAQDPRDLPGLYGAGMGLSAVYPLLGSAGGDARRASLVADCGRLWYVPVRAV